LGVNKALGLRAFVVRSVRARFRFVGFRLKPLLQEN